MYIGLYDSCQSLSRTGGRGGPRNILFPDNWDMSDLPHAASRHVSPARVLIATALPRTTQHITAHRSLAFTTYVHIRSPGTLTASASASTALIIISRTSSFSSLPGIRLPPQASLHCTCPSPLLSVCALSPTKARLPSLAVSAFPHPDPKC
jgi:hypothetical protein